MKTRTFNQVHKICSTDRKAQRTNSGLNLLNLLYSCFFKLKFVNKKHYKCKTDSALKLHNNVLVSGNKQESP